MDFLSYNLANLTANEVKAARNGQANLKARIDAVESTALAQHASKHAPGGTDDLSSYYVKVADVVTTAAAGKILKLDASSMLPASITGDAATVGGKSLGTTAGTVAYYDSNGQVQSAMTASRLTAARTIGLSGDASGSVSFDGSANVTITAALANSGVTAGTYQSVTVDTKGRVTAGTSLSATDIPPLTLAKISDAGTVASKDTGTASGNVPILGTDGKLDAAVLPAIAIADTFIVASDAAMTALTAEVGDVAVRTDLNKSLILKAAPASTLGNWQELLTPTDAVLSVNGKTGVVSLSYTDVGAAASGHTHPAAVANGPSGLMTGTDKDKLDNIAAGAEVNQNAFSTVTVAGQSSVIADARTDTLNLVAGNGIQITTDAATDTLTITNVAVGANAFGRVVAGGVNVDADSTADTLNLVAGAGIQITADAANDTLTITNVSQGANAFGVIKVGTTAIDADSVGDTLEFVAGANITLTPDATNDKVTVAVTGVAQASHSHATSDVTGLDTALSGKVNTADVVTTAAASKILKLDASAKLPASITGDANSVGGQTLTNLDSRYAAAAHNHDDTYLKVVGGMVDGKLNLNSTNGRLVIPVGTDKWATA